MKTSATYYLLAIITLTSLTIANLSHAESPTNPSKEQLGKQLFNDQSLSKSGTQSCASCHDSQHAFIDSRKNIQHKELAGNTVSLGQDKRSLGDINAPSLTYAALVPDFHFDKEEGLFIGGLFLNGRAKNLKDQAKQPFTNPIEMQTTPEVVVSKVTNQYGDSLKSLYGDDIFSSTDKAFDAIADSIAAFERTKAFSSFDSKFDRVLQGKEQFTPEEQRGHDIFVDEDKANCAACHPVPELTSSKQDSLFTDFTYDNLGVPSNHPLRVLNGLGGSHQDDGLYNNPQVNDPELKGAFRVSSLRNIAVTAPYMHNGIFTDLRTVISFYNDRDVEGAINPETGNEWRKPEVDATKNTEELGDLGLKEDEIDDILAFLKTLTDQRYEHLMADSSSK